MEWSNQEEKEKCLDCLHEAIEKNIPAIKRLTYIEDLPCSKHGHPGIIPARLEAWIQFFGVIAPYSTPQTLDHSLISKICAEMGIPFVKAFEMLSTIQKAVVKYGKGHNRRGPKENEAEGSGLSEREAV